MTLVRVWRGQVLGMVGAAMTVPVALVASLAVLALAGGFGGLSALGQAFTGPALPSSQPATARSQSSTRPVPTALVAALSAPAGRAATVSGGAPTAQGAEPSAGSQPTTTAGGSPNAPSSSGPGGSSSGSPQRPHHAPGPSSTASPQPQPTVVDRVVTAGSSVTSQVPGPAGSAATKALQSAGSTVDSIAPIKLQ